MTRGGGIGIGMGIDGRIGSGMGGATGADAPDWAIRFARYTLNGGIRPTIRNTPIAKA